MRSARDTSRARQAKKRGSSSSAREIGGVRFGRGARLAFIAGPCVIEDASVVLETAHELKSISERLGVGLVFKAS